MTQSKLPKHKHEAYTHRDVASLPPPFTKWTTSFEKIQRTHNRILQPGFMHRDVDAVLADAKKAGVAWLTDVCCPSAKADIMLHISKEMVVNYQVADKELNIAAHAVYASLVKSGETALLKSINTEVDRQLQLISEAKIKEDAETLLLANFKAEGLTKEAITPEQLEAAMRIVVDKERRKIMDTIVPGMVATHLHLYADTNDDDSLNLVRKTRHPIGETHDFFYGGPAGSGKSTISKKDLSDDGLELNKINRKDCITVATDIYRAFTLPGTDDHEQIETKDVFTRTQDFAYMVKEQVLKELKGMQVERPNLINDGVTVEYQVRAMLAQTKPENLVSKVALYRGDEAGYRGIAERALKRAKDKSADPADKGRYIETTSLFSGHADASQLFLANLPGNAITEVYDTNVNRDPKEGPVEDPVKVATVDSSNKTVEILNLRIMSEWLNKKNLNIEAEHPVELILKKESPQRVTHPENKATAIIDLTKGLKIPEKWVDVPPYTVTLKADGVMYASLLPGGKLQVLDLAKFKEQVGRESSPEAQVLRAITRQTKVATAAVLDSPEAQAAEFVEQVDKHIASTHETAVKKITQEAHIASRKRLGEEEDRDRIAYTAALLEARIDLMEEEGPGLDALETTFNEVVDEARMMELVLGDEQENAISQQAINSLEGVQEFYLKTSGALKSDLDAFFEHHTDAFQLGNLELPVKDLKKLLVRYHPDHNDQGVEQGYKELYEIFAYLKNERDKVNQKGIGKQTEALATSDKSQSQIEFSQARQQLSFFGGGASSSIDRSITEAMRKENLKIMAQQADSFPPEDREKIIEYFKTLPQEDLLDIKNESATAQLAWDQQYGLVLR